MIYLDASHCYDGEYLENVLRKHKNFGDRRFHQSRLKEFEDNAEKQQCLIDQLKKELFERYYMYFKRYFF